MIDKTRHDEHDETGQDTPLVVDVATAASMLNITEDAVRRRIARGKLPARKDATGKWQIILSSADTTDQDTTPAGQQDTDRGGGYTTTHEPHDTTTRQDETRQAFVVPDAARSQLETLREGLVAPLAELIERQGQRIEEQAELIGRLEQERNTLLAERDALQARVAAIEQEQDVGDSHPAEEQATRKRWWQRFLQGS